MRKRKELASEEKVSLVEEYLAGRLRMREAAREARLGHSTMENWISRIVPRVLPGCGKMETRPSVSTVGE